MTPGPLGRFHRIQRAQTTLGLSGEGTAPRLVVPSLLGMQVPGQGHGLHVPRLLQAQV